MSIIRLPPLVLQAVAGNSAIDVFKHGYVIRRAAAFILVVHASGDANDIAVVVIHYIIGRIQDIPGRPFPELRTRSVAIGRKKILNIEGSTQKANIVDITEVGAHVDHLGAEQVYHPKLLSLGMSIGGCQVDHREFCRRALRKGHGKNIAEGLTNSRVHIFGELVGIGTWIRSSVGVRSVEKAGYRCLAGVFHL